MTKRLFAAAVSALAVAFPLTTSAADKNGEFAVSGAGQLTCRDYINTKRQNPEIQRTAISWVSGFFTAYNAAMENTYDIAPWHSPQLITGVINNHCENNQDDTLFQTVWLLIKSMETQKLAEKSDLVTIKAQGGEVIIYREMVTRIEYVLESAGFYAEQPGQTPAKRLEKALKDYQTANDLPTSGLPDQATLVHMFQISESE